MAVYFGKEKILNNGVADTPLVTSHAFTHGAGGTDPLAPADIGAAPAEHTHDYAAAPRVLTLALPKSGWVSHSVGCVQTISADGIKGDSLLLITSHPDHYDEFITARVRCTVQGWGALTFSAKKLPLGDINILVMLLG